MDSPSSSPLLHLVLSELHINENEGFTDCRAQRPGNTTAHLNFFFYLGSIAYVRGR